MPRIDTSFSTSANIVGELCPAVTNAHTEFAISCGIFQHQFPSLTGLFFIYI